jgi:hypothetical protein
MSFETELRPIAATDRVSDVLARDESLVQVFVRLGPQFSKLRNRAMRRVMARLVTVEQAARMAGVSAGDLLRDLNSAIGSAPGDAPADSAVSAGRGEVGAESGIVDTRSVHPLDACIVEVDVRDDLRAGREPFSKIMAAMSTLAPREVLHLRTTFEPLPLYTVMEKRRFLHEAEIHADDDWSVWFWRNDGDRDAPGVRSTQATTDLGAPRRGNSMPEPPKGNAESAADLSVSPRPNEIWLDVRGLEPPEPLVQTLAALDVLPEGATFVQINARVPQFLLPMIAERGFACEIDDSGGDRVLVRIWRAK